MPHKGLQSHPPLKEKEEKKKKEEKEITFRSEETGRPSGITKGGKTFLGLSPEDVAKIAADDRVKPETEQEKKLKQQLAARELLEERQPVPPEPPQPAPQPTQELDAQGRPLLSGEVSSAEGLITELATTKGLASLGFLGLGKKIGKKGAQQLDLFGKKAVTELGKKEVKGKLKILTSGIASKAFKTGAGIAVSLFGISKLVGQPVSRLQSIDTALGQIRETITAPVAGVRNGALTPSEGLDAMDDLEDAIDEYESSLKALENKVFLTTFNREKMDSAQIRVRKLRQFINVGRQDIALVAVSGRGLVPDSELIAIMLEDLSRNE